MSVSHPKPSQNRRGKAALGAAFYDLDGTLADLNLVHAALFILANLGEWHRRVASIAGLGGAPPELPAIGYHASKGGVISFTKDLACKWAVHNIQVNAIAPGWFPTHMSNRVLERHSDVFLSHIPMRRFGSEHDLKGSAVFLASDASNYVTGHVLVVD